MRDEDRNDRLVIAASGLATEIAPERDLWPGIAERIAGPQRSGRLRIVAQAAAVVLLVGASSGVTYWSVKEEPHTQPIAGTDLVVQPVSLDSRYEPGPAYAEAHVNLAAQLEEELERLSPETRAEVERNLAVVRAAIAEINAALAAEPTNPLLQELLLRAYRDEMALMHRVGELTRRVMARRDI